jgi:hypothetical protein
VCCTVFVLFPCMCYITLFLQHCPLLRMGDLLLVMTLNCWTFCNFITRFTRHITKHELTTTELSSSLFSALTSCRKQRFFTNAYVSINISIRHPNKTTLNFCKKCNFIEKMGQCIPHFVLLCNEMTTTSTTVVLKPDYVVTLILHCIVVIIIIILITTITYRI